MGFELTHGQRMFERLSGYFVIRLVLGILGSVVCARREVECLVRDIVEIGSPYMSTSAENCRLSSDGVHCQ